MKLFKKLLKLLLFLVVLVLTLSAFVDGRYAVQREVTIVASKSKVYQYVKFIKNQAYYSKWQKMDPHMKRIYKGEDGTVGFVARWESEKENVGVGEQEITRLEPNCRIETELRFEKPFEQTDCAFFSFEDEGDFETKVVWGFTGEFKYPMNLMIFFIDLDKMVGDDLQHGLNNLKDILESEEYSLLQKKN